MKFGFLLLCLQVDLVLAQGGNITCSVPIVEPLQDTNLTCSFPEDLNVTKKDFSVYHYNKGVDSDAVLDCWWHGGNMECIQSPNVQYNQIVNKTLSLTIQRVTTNNTGTYACQVAGYDPSYFKTCDLQVRIVNVETTQTADQSVSSSAVGLSVGVLLGVLLLVTLFGLGILVYRGTIRIVKVVCKSHASQPNEEHQPMIQIQEKRKTPNQKEIRKRMLEEYLEKEVSNMFPKIFESAYFVPPVYFNKIREKQLDVADQTVTVLEPPDPCDVRHDRAMQHVLNCLHDVAMAGVEQMFVLTQFKYTDYLNSIPEQFKGHLLPVPSLVHEHQQNRSFDLLIIHRRYGVMVGVVRDCSSNGDEGQPDNDTDTIRLSQVSEATEQLNTAKRFVSEVMSDKENFPKVRKVLVLFGIAHPTVESLPDNNQSPNDLRTLYLENIPDCLEPNSCLVKEKFKEEWDKLATESRHIFALNEKQYLGIIGRFCGPATSTVLSMESKSYQLPKTLRDAVSLTGDVFERSFLYPNMTKLPNERFLFLAGPPGTGKTRMLALVGRKWVLEGHPVHIISTSPGGEQVAKHLKQLISSSESPEPKNVFHLNLNLEDTKNVTSKLDLIQQNSQENSQEAYVIAVELNFQMRQAAKRTLALAVKLASYGYGVVKSTIDYAKESDKETSQQEPSKTNNEIGIDDIPPTGENIQRRKSVASLFTELCRRFPNLYMWGAGCTDLDLKSKVPDLRIELLTECLTCPPSVVREASEKIRISGVGKYTANQSHVPTSGPPVKHLNHQEHLVKNPPQECITCATDIINFLINDLLIKDKNIKEEVDTQEILTSHLLQSDPIQYSDILIFFESEVNVDTPMVQSLLAEGIPVQVINHPNQSTEVTQDKNSVLVAKSSLYLGYKRKVVVFVEGDTDSNDITVRWNRLRCWTCCSSQLILVHNEKT